ncbi:MAG: Asp-tRNA(Asn)/Glu-tRNA(Gln) amidotransferase subunit GatC [Bdellovibrionaceae bacterium]|nr:Asp-tRNA(Asn)/Glu-tRNA(Gln) amidotransferase subunit GatC [Pseudobdellovibrionaceae bacterium]
MSTVKDIQKKACIKLSKKEEAYYENAFSEILKYVQQIVSVNSKEDTPIYTHDHIPKQLREDTVENSTVVNSILEQAPQKEGNYFKVPPVLGGK